MRCYICDYTANGPVSDYHDGLELDRTGRRVRYNHKTGQAVCDHCLNMVKETNEEFTEEEEAEV